MSQSHSCFSWFDYHQTLDVNSLTYNNSRTVWKETMMTGPRGDLTEKRAFPGLTWKCQCCGWMDGGPGWVLSALFQSLLGPDCHCLWRRKLSVDLREIRVANCSLCAFLFCYGNSLGTGTGVGVEVGKKGTLQHKADTQQCGTAGLSGIYYWVSNIKEEI